MTVLPCWEPKMLLRDALQRLTAGLRSGVVFASQLLDTGLPAYT